MTIMSLLANFNSFKKIQMMGEWSMKFRKMRSVFTPWIQLRMNSRFNKLIEKIMRRIK